MDECREAFEKWARNQVPLQRVYKMYGSTVLTELENHYTRADANLAWESWQAAWTARQTETIRHAYNAGVAWSIGNGKDIDEYLEAQK